MSELMKMDNFKVTINDLPVEVILGILARLDIVSLKNSCLVCRKWNEIIESSAETMKNFVLNLDAERLKKFDANFQSRRKHLSVFIHFEKENEKLLDHVENFDLSQVRRVSFNRYKSSIHIRKVRKVLSRMPMLEDASLMLNHVDSVKRNWPLRLENLKRIRFFPKSSNALTLFSPKKIVEVRIEESPIDDNIEKVVGFLQRTINLKILRVNKFTFNAIFEHERNFSFQLRTVDMLYNSTQVAAVVNENFAKFLRSQTLSLKVLDLSGLEGLSEAVHRTIFNQMNELEKLTIDGAFLPNMKQFYEILKPNKSLKSVKILKNFSSDDAAKGILVNLPELEKLELEFSISSKINLIARHMPKLKDFSYSTVLRPCAKELKFNSLTSFSVLHIVDLNDWLAIINSSPNIKSLSVFWVDENDAEKIVEYSKWNSNIQNLKLIGNYNSINLVLNKLKVHHGCLRSIELAVKMRPSSPIMAELKVQFDQINRNIQQEKKFLAQCVWTEICNGPACNGLNDIIKFKFETKNIVTVLPWQLLL